MRKALVIVSICLCFAGRANAQWVVSDPGNLGFLETQKIFQQSKRFYDALKSVHDVVKGGVKVGKSIALVAEISEIYVRNFQNMLYRNLVNYYTRKNISVSYLRAKKKNDTDRVLALYGSADERYW